MKLEINSEYKFKHQSTVLVYTGIENGWHQFEKKSQPDIIWCEMLDEDLHMLESVK